MTFSMPGHDHWEYDTDHPEPGATHMHPYHDIITNECAEYVTHFGVETSGPNFIALHDGLKRRIGSGNMSDDLMDILILTDRINTIRAGDGELEYKPGHPEYPYAELIAIDNIEEQIRSCVQHIK